MMNKLILSCILLFCAVQLHAQPSITAASMNPLAGEVFASLPLDTASVQPGAAGANLSWDFSSLIFIYNPIYDSYHAASATPYAGSFPDANIASENNITSGEFFYHKTTSTGWEILGYANNLYDFSYSNKQQAMTYPFTYNSVINDTYGGTTTHSGMTVTRTGTYFKKGIAYGGLTLPTGNFSGILLTQSIDAYSDAYGGTTPTTYGYNVTEYSWVSVAYKFPLLYKRIIEVSIDGVVTSTLAMARVSTAVSGIGESSNDDGRFALYPVPATTEINLGFYEQYTGEIVVDCFTITGQKVANLYTGKADPSNSVLTFDVSSLKEGLYLMQINTPEGMYMKKFVIR
jgi:hypothetical protein